MFKNQIKGYLLAAAVLSLTACGGGGGGSSSGDNSSTGSTGGTTQAKALSLSTNQSGATLVESSVISFNVSSTGGTGSVSYSASVTAGELLGNSISASADGNEVTVSVPDLEYSGEFSVTVTGTDSAGKSDDIVISFNVENTSAQPVLAALNAMFESKYEIANLKEERDVLVKIAKAAYYGSDDFKQSDLDAALIASEKETDADWRQSVLDLFKNKFYNQDLSTNEYLSETELNAALVNANTKIAEYLSEINGEITKVATKSGDTLPSMDLNGTLYISGSKVSQFIGNSAFMDADTQAWNESYGFLAGVLDPSLIACNAG